MAELINLRTARKRAQREQGELRAHSNRLAHARPKAERKLDAARQNKASQDLDRHHIEPGDGR